MIKLNYYSHVLLNSKYKLFLNLCIIYSLYFIFNNFSYCMTEDWSLSTTGETKEIQNQAAKDLKDEITAYAGNTATLLEQLNEKDKIIEALKVRLEAEENYANSLARTLEVEHYCNDKLLSEMSKHDPDFHILIPIFSHGEDATLQQVGNETDSENEFISGDTRVPYYTNYGSDSDNDLGETW